MSEFNSMCMRCENFNVTCPGTTCKMWTGCVNHKQSKLDIATEIINVLYNSDISSVKRMLEHKDSDQTNEYEKTGYKGLSEAYIKENIKDFLY